MRDSLVCLREPGEYFPSLFSECEHVEDFCNEDQRQQGWRGKQGKCAMHHAGHGNINNEAFLDLPHQHTLLWSVKKALMYCLQAVQNFLTHCGES